MPIHKIIAILLTASILASCNQGGAPGPGLMHGGSTLNKEDVGTGIGAIGGGILGSTIGSGAGKTAAVIGGILLGGILGNVVGQSLDNADRAAYDRASQQAMEQGKRQSWKNTDNGHHGTITPTKRYTNDEGQSCRDYTQSIYVDGKRHTGHGTACREADGSWHIANG